MLYSIYQCDICAGDGRRARPAIGLQHIAVDPNRAPAEFLHIDDRAQAAADQSLNFLNPPSIFPPRFWVAAGRCSPAACRTRRQPAQSLFFRHSGTASSTQAVQRTCVLPDLMRTEPGARR